ncbi:hypothetical protein LguiA_015717 [Lonicera macranthoides]
MAEKNQQLYPLAPVTGYPRSDQESSYPSNYQSNELRKKRRLKCLAYIAIFAVFQTIVIVVFALTVMRVKSPRVRLERVTVQNSTIDGNKRLSAQVIVKNTNFGHYKFESGTATLVNEGGVTVGQFVIPEARARARSTKRIDILVDVSGGGDGGVVVVTGRTRLRGKVVFMKVLKRKKSADMDCTLSIDFSRNDVQRVTCR